MFGTILGVLILRIIGGATLLIPIMRIIVSWGLYWKCPDKGSYFQLSIALYNPRSQLKFRFYLGSGGTFSHRFSSGKGILGFSGFCPAVDRGSLAPLEISTNFRMQHSLPPQYGGFLKLGVPFWGSL